jgi:hypothetical protein
MVEKESHNLSYDHMASYKYKHYDYYEYFILILLRIFLCAFGFFSVLFFYQKIQDVLIFMAQYFSIVYFWGY